MNIDIEDLRQALIDYFGTAMMQNPMAIMDLSKVENASAEELIEIAYKNGIKITINNTGEHKWRR